MLDQSILDKLNRPGRENRLAALRDIMRETDFIPADERYINNHIHTFYSFSPYSPTAAVFAARSEGLATAGIVDHDSIAGAFEFIEAGKIAGIPTTVGIECRVLMKGTPFEERRTNNPDQTGVSYMTIHAVAHDKIDMLQSHFAPLREKRNARNRSMTENINALFSGSPIKLDFDNDVVPISMAHEGGSITERHLMFALCKAIIKAYGRGEGAIEFLKKTGIELTPKQTKLLTDTGNRFYEYDLLGILKSAFLPKVFIPASDECMTLNDIAELAGKIGAIACYAYLGDVYESVTGDKKAQKFEDDYLPELFQTLRENGIRAVTYMPTRNTPFQLTRVRALCEKFGMFQVSGEDINSPRQSFVVRAMEDPLFSNLIGSTKALIAHENGKKKINYPKGANQ